MGPGPPWNPLSPLGPWNPGAPERGYSKWDIHITMHVYI